jgi:phosphatidyl-myo-inositol dimannoside synthase
MKQFIWKMANSLFMSEKKYILFTLEFPPLKGGISAYYSNLAKYWPAGDLIVLTDGASSPNEPANIIRRQLLNKYFRPRWLKATLQLYQTISNFKFKISNFHIIVGQILPLGQAVYFLNKFIKIKYSVILHGLDFSLATIDQRKKKITKKILQRADKLVCANTYTANLVKVFAGDLAEKISVVNPAIEPIFIRNPQQVREIQQKYSLENKVVLLSLGRLVLRKGFDKVIEAMNSIGKFNANIIYVIAGDGSDADVIKKMADNFPIEIKNKIIFTSAVSDVDRWAWLELCDIFIMPSRNINGDFEGFGTVYLEANLAGKPVIAGDSGGVRDAVINNVNGLLVNPESAEDIVAAVIKLAADPQLRLALGEQGKRRVVENFNAKKMAEKIYNLMQMPQISRECRK